MGAIDAFAITDLVTDFAESLPEAFVDFQDEAGIIDTFGDLAGVWEEIQQDIDSGDAAGLGQASIQALLAGAVLYGEVKGAIA